MCEIQEKKQTRPHEGEAKGDWHNFSLPPKTCFGHWPRATGEWRALVRLRVAYAARHFTPGKSRPPSRSSGFGHVGPRRHHRAAITLPCADERGSRLHTSSQVSTCLASSRRRPQDECAVPRFGSISPERLPRLAGLRWWATPPPCLVAAYMPLARSKSRALVATGVPTGAEARRWVQGVRRNTEQRCTRSHQRPSLPCRTRDERQCSVG